jgi:hypothetical protein
MALVIYLFKKDKGGGAMRVSREKAAENRNRIVQTAARMFREKGVDGVGMGRHPAVQVESGVYCCPRGWLRLCAQALRCSISDLHEGTI